MRIADPLHAACRCAAKKAVLKKETNNRLRYAKIKKKRNRLFYRADNISVVEKTTEYANNSRGTKRNRGIKEHNVR